MASGSRRKRLPWGILGIVLILALVVAAVIPAVRAARVAARRSERAYRVRQIGLAIHNFHDAYKCLPPAVRTDELGRPLSSWRFQIDAYTEGHMLDIDYGKAWDHPDNQRRTAHPHYCFCFFPEGNSPERMHTNVVAVTGPGTAFDGDRPCRLGEIDPDTILAIEVVGSDTHWAEPGALEIDEIPESIMAGIDGFGVLVLFADGTVRFLDRDVPLEDLEKFLTIEGAKKHDREEVFGAKGTR